MPRCRCHFIYAITELMMMPRYDYADTPYALLEGRAYDYILISPYAAEMPPAATRHFFFH